MSGNDWQSLIAGSMSENLKPEPVVLFKPLNEYLEGQYIGDSRIFLRHKHYPLNELFSEEIAFTLPVTLRNYSRIFLQKDLDPDKILFIDTETTGLNRSPGTFVFLMGIGRIKHDQFIITQYFVEEMDHEILLYDLLEEIFLEAELFVSYNGKSFDVPLLQSRLFLQSKTINIRKIPHLDLLPLARRLWKTLVDSFSLSSMEYRLLNKIRECEEDVPGYQIPFLYAQYQQTGDPVELIPVFYHNQDDISSLFSLFCIIRNIFEDPHKSIESQWLNILELGRLFEQIQDHDLAITVYEYAYAKNHPQADYYLAKLYKKKRMLDKAVPIWQLKNDYESLVELSMWAEKNKDYPQALTYANTALSLIGQTSLLNPKLIAEITKRIDRLEQKV